uniref:Piwi domain-containing protein n=1 Tax=Strigamia maritima TaxID=126957 RepID=T1JMK8_STRMM
MSDQPPQRPRGRGRLHGDAPRRPHQTPYDRPPPGRGPRPPSQSRPPGPPGPSGDRPRLPDRSSYSQPPPSGYSRPRLDRPPGPSGAEFSRRDAPGRPTPRPGYSRGDQPPSSYGPRPGFSRDAPSSAARPGFPRDAPPSSFAARPGFSRAGPPSSFAARPGPARDAPSSSFPSTSSFPPLPPGSGDAPPRRFTPPQPMEQSAGPSRGPAAGRGIHRRGIELYQPDPTVTPSKDRSKFGKMGKPVDLVVNYFPLDSLPNKAHNQYQVDFVPEVEDIHERKRLLYTHKPVIGVRSLFDGGAILFTTIKLHNEVTELTSNLKSDNSEVKIKVTFKKQLSSRDPIVLQMLNIQMRRNMMNLNFKLIRGEYYDLQQAAVIQGHKIELIPGFVTSIRQHETSLLMCVDLAFKSIRQDTVLAIIRNHYNNRTYRVAEIAIELIPGFVTSICQHETSLLMCVDLAFKSIRQDTRNCRISDAGQPLLMIKPSAKDVKRGLINPIYLIPEFCLMTGYDDDMKSDFRTMKAISDHMRTTPTDRINRMTQFIQRINSNDTIKEEMKERGFQIRNNLVTLKGRQFPPEGIVLTANPTDKGTQYSEDRADWSRSMQGKRLLQPIRLANWLLVYTRRDERIVSDFLTTFKTVCRPMGMEINNPTMCMCADDRTQTISSTLHANITERTQLVFVILPNNSKERYDCVKKICCVDIGVASQVALGTTLSKKSIMSIATKIAIQMNCKIGGAAWTIFNPFQTTKIMVVGIDTYKDSAQRAKAVCATVCTMNNMFTKYFSQVSFQDPKQEMSDAFVVQLSNALRTFTEVNASLPTVLMFYRDGVGDGQLPLVREWEIKQIREAISKQTPGYDPKILFVIVNKRINTRFFKNSTNPTAGTVVDTVVTRPERYDFFLISQSVTQGTVAPTMYNVILDTTGLAPDRIQLLTYKMTHLYFNWQGTIRVPAPVQYAHKFAFLVGQSLHTAPHERLANTLYYL